MSTFDICSKFPSLSTGERILKIG